MRAPQPSLARERIAPQQTRVAVALVDGRLKARISGEERASGPNIFTGCTAEKLPVERPLA